MGLAGDRAERAEVVLADQHRRRRRIDEHDRPRPRHHDRVRRLLDQRAEAPERDHQASDEQQVIRAVEDVEEAELDETPRRLMPPRIQPDEAGIAHVEMLRVLWHNRGRWRSEFRELVHASVTESKTGAAINIVPTSTGAARATSLVLESMKGKLDLDVTRVLEVDDLALPQDAEVRGEFRRTTAWQPAIPRSWRDGLLPLLPFAQASDVINPVRMRTRAKSRPGFGLSFCMHGLITRITPGDMMR